MRAVIVDTSAIYALVDADDIHHARAAAFVRREAPHIRLLVTDVTLFESITLIKSRLGHSAASRALHSVRSSGRFRVIELTDQDRAETWRLFEQCADKAWSPFDCACLVAARARKIREAFAFDAHFDQMAGLGLTRVP